MKTKSKISAYIVRGSAAALLVSCVIVALSSAISLPSRSPKLPVQQNNAAFGANSQESILLQTRKSISRSFNLGKDLRLGSDFARIISEGAKGWG